MAERSNAAVLKTVDGKLSGGSNPSLSATQKGRHMPSFLRGERKPLLKARGRASVAKLSSPQGEEYPSLRQ